MKNDFSPYCFPGIDMMDLDVRKYPFAKKYRAIHGDDAVFDAVQSIFKLSKVNILSRSRIKELVYVRALLSFIFIKHFRYTLDKTGKLTGGRDHATALHNSKTHVDLYRTQRDYYTKSNLVFDILKINSEKLK